MVAKFKASTRKRAGLPSLLMLVILVEAIFITRIVPVLATDFPLNDGGMFYTMVRDLVAAGFALPHTTSYNHQTIPFVYPPLAFYVAAALQAGFGFDLIQLFRWLPAIVSMVGIVAVFGFARTVLKSIPLALLTTTLFLLIPDSFRWLIMGGGLTRSFGLLFFTFGVHQAYLLYTRRSTRYLWWGIVAAVGAVLSHPEMAWVLALTIAYLFLVFGRNRFGLVYSGILGLVAAILTAPWWLTMLARHGVEPFLAAPDHGWPEFQGMISLLFRPPTGEPFMPIILLAALLGMLICMRDRRRWLVGWLLLIYALDSWVPSTPASLIWAILATIGFHEGVRPLLGRSVLKSYGTEHGRSMFGGLTQVVVLGGAFVYASFSALYIGGIAIPHLHAEERAAMAWVSKHLPESAAVLIVRPDPWGQDVSSEWFPALAGRTSVATVQGSEWLSNGEFVRRYERHVALRICTVNGPQCVEDWIRTYGLTVSHLYVPKTPGNSSTVVAHVEEKFAEDCCRPLRSALDRDPDYTVLYDGPGATVYAWQAEMAAR